MAVSSVNMLRLGVSVTGTSDVYYVSHRVPMQYDAGMPQEAHNTVEVGEFILNILVAYYSCVVLLLCSIVYSRTLLKSASADNLPEAHDTVGVGNSMYRWHVIDDWMGPTPETGKAGSTDVVQGHAAQHKHVWEVSDHH
jgi:hypothetical protein